MRLWERARGRWLEILTGIGMEAAALNGKHQACPACGGKDRFRYLRNDEGGFFCSDLRGNGVELVQHVFGLDFKGAAERIESVIGKDSDFKPERKEPTYAERLRAVAKPSKRSAYLESRGLEVAPGLLFATSVEYRDDDGNVVGKYPAMLAPITRDGAWLTFHVTYLERGNKAPVEKPRKVLPGAPIAGGGVALYPAAEEMGVGEGIETCIAAKILFDRPTHAALNTGMLAKWNPPSVAKIVYIFADNDENHAGAAAAWQLAHRLALKGIKPHVMMPALPGADWNDVLNAKNQAKVA